jgi:hypothetical protein
VTHPLSEKIRETIRTDLGVGDSQTLNIVPAIRALSEVIGSIIGTLNTEDRIRALIILRDTVAAEMEAATMERPPATSEAPRLGSVH